jgi:phospholipid transport system substrate-binding protein
MGIGKNMKLFKRILLLALSLGMLGFMSVATAADEAPDVLVKRISQDVLESAKADKDIQGGNQKKILDLVDAKILPYVDFQRMTSLAAGRFWRDATPDQQKQLTEQFRSLLVFTYSGAISSIRDQKLQFAPLRADPDATDGVEVRSQVVQPRGEPIQLNYRMEKLATGWKIYDVNILGAWLVETYKGNFATEIGKGGIDGLIKALADKNKKLSDNMAKGSKA